MLDIVKRKLNAEFLHNSAWNDIKRLIESADEYLTASDEIIDNIDFRSLLYVTKSEDIQYFYNMVISMATYEFEESRKLNITNKKLIVYCSQDRNSFWKDTFKNFEEQLEIFNNFSILSMTLLNYLTGETQYTVILDTDISDEIAYEGINCMQAFLQLPLLTDGKLGYHLWCSAQNVGMIVSMFNDLTPSKLIFKNCYENEGIQEIFGKDEALQQPSDFTFFSGDTTSGWGCKTITESYFDSRKPLGG